MKKDLSMAASIVLILSILIILDRLMATPNIQIVLESGRAVPLESTSFFTLSDVLLLIICAWAGGMAFIYLFTRTSTTDLTSTPTTDVDAQKQVSNDEVKTRTEELALDILDGDEKIAFAKIVESGEGILQRDLVLKTGFSDAKVSRLLDRLERRQLVIRKRHGMGNLILRKK